MTLMEKFTKLTPEQREQFAAVKDEAGLDAFLSEIGAEFTEEEKANALDYIQNGKTELSDDDLDSVAGGAAKNEVEALAIADGRPYMLPASLGFRSPEYICICDHHFKWAREYSNTSACVRYNGVKCYKCGTTFSVYIRYKS